MSRVDVTGGNYTKLYGFTTPNFQGWFTSGVDLDATTGDVYWGDSGFFYNPPAGAVNVMDINGANPMELVPWGAGNGQGRSLAFDGSIGVDGTVFFSAWTTAGGVLNGPQNGAGGIWSLDVNTGIVTQILNDPTTVFPILSSIRLPNESIGLITFAARFAVPGTMEPTCKQKFPVC